MKRFALTIALFAATMPFAAAPSPVLAAPSSAERRMADFVASDAPRGEALLERLVNQNSGTLNLEGVRAAGDMVRPEFEALGFAVSWIDMAETGRAGHLVATHRGNGRGKRILLIGHLDTVFEPGNPFQTYRREGNRAIGPGVGDDKGGVVVIIQALRAMQAAGTLRGADIMVVLTGDEERTGDPLPIARRDLIAAGEWADVALEYENLATSGEGETLAEYGTVARRSSGSWEIRTTGETGHSSGIFSERQGYGAAYELVRILDAFRRELPEANLTYNVGVMAGGTPASIDAAGETVSATGKTNIIASTAIARGDIRTLTVEQDERVRAAMRAIVGQHLPGTTATISFDESYPPMAPTPGNRALLERLNAVNRDLGLPVMAEYDPARRGAADSSFVAALADTMGGLGAAGGLAHADGEWIDLESLPRQALRSAALISRLSREPR
ncbi:M20/M25/M40 family metallo-hydrolase [Sphingomonas lacunae]|uniref:M20/M25/M40 family metallo-hydrolase n=1 Tax=Sphingomonas lacunae TaxID=2698828 RepID=A0A6M4AU16_9SPHN|nr:M20/M25/M40 family metallo-hydrolase [Sphingomonas lacunae]QJQ31842.1 M20/M25/M40 family metallo-hydrolase [Sphingomonas lacunae]